MKTKLYLFFTFFLLTLTLSAQPQNYKNFLMEDWLNNAWVNSTRGNNTYDTKGNLIKTEMEEYTDGKWQNAAIITYTLNEDNTVKETMTQAWVEGNWTDAMKTAYTYNGNKQVLTAYAQMNAGGMWIDFSKITYTYNDQNQLTNQVTQIANILTMQLVNSEQETYSYNSDGTENQVTTQTWNTSNQWENATRFTNTYDNSKKVIADLNEKWENNAWVNDLKTSYTFNAAGLIQESTSQTWVNNAWVNSLKDVFTYKNNDITEILTQKWDTSLSQWQNDSRLTYTYGGTGIHTAGLTSHSLEVFPNPFTDQVTIQSGLTGMHSIEVFNTSGQLIYSVKTSENSYKMDLGTLEKGVYLIKTPQNNQSTKIIKTR